MPQIETCINTLQTPADQLLKEGIDPLFIMAALAEIIVDVAKTDRNFAATHLESVGAEARHLVQGAQLADGLDHPRVMTVDKLRYAQHLMADRSRSIPSICRELGGIPSSTLYHYLHADGSLKEPGRKLLTS